MSTKAARKKNIVAGILIICLAVVGFWEVMANRSRRPFDVFRITAAHFEEFDPGIQGWSATKLPVNASPIEPNVLAVELRYQESVVRSQESGNEGEDVVAELWSQSRGREAVVSGPLPKGADPRGPVLVRLAHGYNMPDCMRIKGYEVEEVGDQLSVISDQLSVISGQREEGEAGRDGGVQVWRLTSDIGDVSVWVTTMLRAGDFESTDIDVRTMAFPRIGTPDDPAWLPQGITLKSFRHPIRNFNWLIRAKWNNARCDVATFLKLKRPAWADDTLMTFVSAWKGPPLKSEEEEAAIACVLDAHTAMLHELKSWHRARPE